MVDYEEFLNKNKPKNSFETIRKYEKLKSTVNEKIHDDEEVNKLFSDVFLDLNYWIKYSVASEESLREARFNNLDLTEKNKTLIENNKKLNEIINNMISVFHKLGIQYKDDKLLKEVEFISELLESKIPIHDIENE